MLPCITGALGAQRGERGILREAETRAGDARREEEIIFPRFSSRDSHPFRALRKMARSPCLAVKGVPSILSHF